MSSRAAVTSRGADRGERREAGGAVESARFERYLQSFADQVTPSALGIYPELVSQPFYEPGSFAIVQALEYAYAGIRAEIAALDNVAFHLETEAVNRTGSWDVFMLFERGRKHEDNCLRCPAITAVVEAHPTMRTLGGLIYVSRMKPETHIAPHRGPTNLRLRCHLGIEIPEGNCGLRVSGETRRWKEGRCLLFDDSFEHEAWNHTGRPRIVLIVDLWHPALSAAEVRLLRGLHHYCAAQASNLTRYWTANSKARADARKIYD